MSWDLTDTSNLSELELRQLQLAEIRAMLMLPRDASHHEVIMTLRKIGESHRAVDPDAVPLRYQIR